MKIIYKGIPLEFVRCKQRWDRFQISFHFKHDDIELVLFKVDGKFFLGEWGPINMDPSIDEKTNKLYQFLDQLDTGEKREKEAIEFYDFIFTTPLRLKFLMEYGPEFYQKYK